MMKYIKAKPLSYSPVRRKRGNVSYIVIHGTGNKGDTAIANANYYKNVNTREAGAHFFIDRSGNIVKSIGMDRAAWAVGGARWNDYKKTGGGKLYRIANNFNSVSIELCDIVDKYPSKEQIKAVKKCIKYIRRYCRNAKKVIRHFDVTGKHCPNSMMDERVWNVFLHDIGEK
jgi:N-acetylmuramoyl-L-alanine amidase CwlA